MTFCACQCGGYYTICPFRANAWGICPHNVPQPDSEKAEKRKPRQKKIKVYGTNVMLCSPMVDVAHSLGLHEYARQVRIICGATSLAEANRLCQSNGFYRNVFQRDYTSVTGNETEVALAGNGGIFVRIGQTYYPLSVLKGEEQ